MKKIISLILMAMLSISLFSSAVVASPIDDFFNWLGSLFGIPYSFAQTGEACLINSNCLTNMCNNPLSSLNTGASTSFSGSSGASFFCPNGAKQCVLTIICSSSSSGYTPTISSPATVIGGTSVSFQCKKPLQNSWSGGVYTVQYYGVCTGYVAPICGNSVVETGEQCDPPNSMQSMPDGGYEKCTSSCSWGTEYYLCGGNQVSTKPICSAGSTTSCPSGQVGTVTCKSDCSGYDYSNCQVQACSGGQYYCQGSGKVKCNSFGTGYDQSTYQECLTTSPDCPECVNNQYCTYPNKVNSCPNLCLNGICQSCTPTCGTPSCSYVIDKCTANCVADKTCGPCGVDKCVNGRLQGCQPIQSKCGSGEICQ